MQAKKKRLKGKGHRKAYAASGTAHGHQAYGKSKAEPNKDRLVRLGVLYLGIQLQACRHGNWVGINTFAGSPSIPLTPVTRTR